MLPLNGCLPPLKGILNGSLELPAAAAEPNKVRGQPTRPGARERSHVLVYAVRRPAVIVTPAGWCGASVAQCERIKRADWGPETDKTHLRPSQILSAAGGETSSTPPQQREASLIPKGVSRSTCRARGEWSKVFGEGQLGQPAFEESVGPSRSGVVARTPFCAFPYVRSSSLTNSPAGNRKSAIGK